VGTSSGSIHVFLVNEGSDVSHHCALDAHDAAITALATELDDGETLASADQDGKIVTWASPLFEKESVFAGDGNPVTGLGFKGSTIIASRGSGGISLLNGKTGVAIAEIGGHSRVINALDVHPSLDMFVTAGEDCYVNVWTLPSESGQEISCILNGKVENGFLTGVQFCGPNKASIACTSYDLDKATIFEGTI